MTRTQKQRPGIAGHPPHPHDPDELLTLAQAGRELPPRRNGARPTPSTLWRWARNGLHAGDRRVKLRVTTVGATTCTCRRWLHDFFAALEQARNAPAQPITTNSRKAQQRVARETLRRAGILDDEQPVGPQGAVHRTSNGRSRRGGAR